MNAALLLQMLMFPDPLSACRLGSETRVSIGLLVMVRVRLSDKMDVSEGSMTAAKKLFVVRARLYDEPEPIEVRDGRATNLTEVSDEIRKVDEIDCRLGRIIFVVVIELLKMTKPEMEVYCEISARLGLLRSPVNAIMYWNSMVMASPKNDDHKVNDDEDEDN